MSHSDVIAALLKVLDQDPRNGAVWLHLIELLVEDGRDEEALAALRTASEITESKDQAVLRLIRLLRKRGDLAEALVRAEAVLAERDDPEVRLELARVLQARGDPEQAREQLDQVRRTRPDLLEETLDLTDAPGNPAAADGEAAGSERKTGEPAREALAEVAPESSDIDGWLARVDWGDLHVTLDDVVGLADVKRQVQLRIIAPFKQPEVYQAFGREGGGGILLYGPPGCGKTYIARATAGELQASFVSVSIHEIVDKYWGESEKLIHALFEDARRRSPTVLFFDEFDAFGSKRGGAGSQFWKTLVDQLLQEMDGVHGRNRDVLLLAATNMPWNVDSAFRRPGRFDRVIFVAPPDTEGRRQLLDRHGGRIPGGSGIAFDDLAAKTSLYTGADIKSLCERAAERPLERSLETGAVHEVRLADFERALRETASTALEWFAQARNHARYANEGGYYDDLVAYLRAIKKW